MPTFRLKRPGATVSIALLYLAAAFLLSIFSFGSIKTLAFGLLLGSVGSLLSFFIMRQWETSLQNSPRQTTSTLKRSRTPETSSSQSANTLKEMETALKDLQERHKELVEQLNVKTETVHRLEKDQQQFEERVSDIHREANAFKANNEEEVRRKTVLLSEYQETINQQRDVIKKKQEQIVELESKIHDLNYEVKTLLQLSELGKPTSAQQESKGMHLAENMSAYDATTSGEPSEPSAGRLAKNPAEASQILKRCVDIARKITGASHFGNGNSRFRDLSMDNNALDLRRLCDNLGSENGSAVFVYSQKDNRLLFANQQVRQLLGWAPEKFTQHFSDIVQEGANEWRQGINQLSSDPEANVRLLMKTKSGRDLLVHCHLALVPSGVFRHHLVGVLYPA